LTITPTLTMYGITNCDTIRKARAWLESHDVAYRFHDYRVEGLEAERLDGWVGKVGWEVLLNKASTTFRELSDKEKQGLDEQKAKALMLAKLTVIKRPVLELGDRILVGFKPDVYQQAVGWK
jgi:arsenate reductase